MQRSSGTHQRNFASTFVYMNMVDNYFGPFQSWWMKRLCLFA